MSIVAPLPLPSGVERTWLDVPSGRLAALEADGSSSPRRCPVVLVPGYTGSKEDFRLVLAPLAAGGHHVVAIDQRGQYESEGPDDETAYGVDALASDLLAILEDLGPCHVVGHSFGGLVARAAALVRPAALRSLTLMCSGPAAITGQRRQAIELMRPVLEQGGIVGLADAVEAFTKDDPRTQALPEEVRAFLRTRMLENTAAGLHGMGQALRSEPDRVDQLRESGVPTLVLYGEADDAWSPEVQAEMAQRLGARCVVIPDAMHSPAVENPEPTASALLEFFASTED